MSTSELVISVVALLAIGLGLLAWHYAIVYRSELEHVVSLLPGCCGNCDGSGVDSGAPETGGLCWDCHGTGHTHTGRCAMSWEERAIPYRTRRLPRGGA